MRGLIDAEASSHTLREGGHVFFCVTFRNSRKDVDGLHALFVKGASPKRGPFLTI